MERLGYELPALPVHLERMRVLEYFEGERLVQFRSLHGEIYLKSWLDEFQDVTRWLLFRCTSAGLGRYLAGVWTLRDLLDKHDDGLVYIIDEGTTDNIVSLVVAGDLPQRYMPTSESYFDTDLAPEGGEDIERILLEGRWSVEILSILDRRYRQVYAALAALVSDIVSLGTLATRLSKYTFQGGWIHVKAFDLLVGALPKTVTPQVRAFHYASPGVVEYQVEPALAKLVSLAVHRILVDDGTVMEAYQDLRKELKEFEDWASTGAHDDTELDSQQKSTLREPSERLAKALGLENSGSIWQLTNGNYLNAGHILCSYYRRLRELADLHDQGNAKISSVLQTKTESEDV